MVLAEPTMAREATVTLSLSPVASGEHAPSNATPKVKGVRRCGMFCLRLCCFMIILVSYSSLPRWLACICRKGDLHDSAFVALIAGNIRQC
jgi:hypothetical protein